MIGPEDDYNYMVIVLEGLLEVTTDMDKSTDFPIDYLSSGSVINSHQFMIERKSSVNIKCVKSTTIYKLSAHTFSEIAYEYPKLQKARNEEYEQALEDAQN